MVAGDLVPSTDGGLVATFLPVLLDAGRGSRGSLLGHLARKNDQWQRAVRGELVVHDETAWVGALVRRLTDRHEAHREDPWSVDDAPARFTAGRRRAIVGVELVISRVEVKVKMSQNRPERDIDGVVTGLEQEGRPEAAAMVDRSRS